MVVCAPDPAYRDLTLKDKVVPVGGHIFRRVSGQEESTGNDDILHRREAHSALKPEHASVEDEVAHDTH